jgi:hypothetical protein
LSDRERLLIRSFLCLSRLRWQLLHVRKKLWLAWNVLPEDLRDFDAIFRLVVFQYAAQLEFEVSKECQGKQVV